MRKRVTDDSSVAPSDGTRMGLVGNKFSCTQNTKTLIVAVTSADIIQLGPGRAVKGGVSRDGKKEVSRSCDYVGFEPATIVN